MEETSSKTSTLQDVARRAGVSTATVSRTLNNPSLVKPGTRERIERAVTELGYTPHFGGRALASNRTNTVGAVIPTMENAIFARGLQALQDRLSEANVTLLVATSHYDQDREQAQIRALLARGVDALVLIGEAREQSTYDLIKARGVPFVILWTYQPNGPASYIGFDNFAASRLITEHVLAKGHRKIAMIAGITAGNDRAAIRAQGVRATLAEKGIDLREPFFAEADYDIRAGADVAEAMLARENRPTAIICGNDVLAVGAIGGIRSAGLRVPDDVSVVGFDDIDLALVVEPALTTIRVPHRRMGRAAAEYILANMAGEETDESILIDVDLIERGSLAECRQD